MEGKKAILGARAGPCFFFIGGPRAVLPNGPTPKPERNFFEKKSPFPNGTFFFDGAEGVVSWERLGWAGEAAPEGEREPESGGQ